MKILYIANSRIPTEKAHGVQIMNMAKAFAECGAEVEVALPNRSNPITEDPFAFYNIHRLFNIKKFFTLDLINFGTIGFLIQSLTFYFSVLRYGISSDADIIYSRDPQILFLLSFWKHNLVWEVHTKRDDWFTKKLLPKLKLLVCISGGLKEYYESIGNPGPAIVAHDAVDLSEFDNGGMDKPSLRHKFDLPLNRNIVAYVGKYRTMGKQKGVEELLKIFADAYEKADSLFFLLVGINDNEVAEVSGLCHAYGLPNDSYKIVTHVHHAVACQYLKSADIAVMNYPDTEHYARFMSPLKMFEYMAAQCAIVSTDLPSIREVLSNMQSAVLVADGDTQAFVSAILSLAENPDLAKRLSHMAYAEVVQKYTWQKRAENILSHI